MESSTERRGGVSAPSRLLRDTTSCHARFGFFITWRCLCTDPAWSQAFRAWEKITPRAALAAGASFTVAVLLGPRWIAWLDGRFREPIKSDSPEIVRLHRQKQATPTMGGLFIIAALLASVLLFGDPRNGYVAAALLVAGGMTLVGIVDDLVKLRSTAKGISVRHKLAAQVAVAGVAATLLYQQQAAVADGLLLRVPCTGTAVSLGLWFIPLALIVIVGASNAVNLTDGLDGLAGGCLLAATAAMTALVYAAGHAEWAAYLGVPRIPHAGEMTVLAGGMIGGVLGFLWFNCHPAQVFMGNTGALPLGGTAGGAGRRRPARTAAGGRRRRVRRRGHERHRSGRLLQVAAAALAAVCAAASPFSTPRLGREQDRRPLLDRRGPVRFAGHCIAEAGSRKGEGEKAGEEPWKLPTARPFGIRNYLPRSSEMCL